MKGKMELLTNFKWILKMSIPMVEMLKKEIQSLCNYPFVRFGALEEVFMSYRPHGAWRTMEVSEELA
jgi:hypothetical protein